MIRSNNSAVIYTADDNHNRFVKVYLDDDGCLYEETPVNKKRFGFSRYDLPTWMPEDENLAFVQECRHLFGDAEESPRKGIKHISFGLERSEKINSDEYEKLIGIFSVIGRSERQDIYIGQGGYGYLTDVHVRGENLIQKLLELYQKTPEIQSIHWIDSEMIGAPAYMYNYRSGTFVRYFFDSWKELYA